MFVGVILVLVIRLQGLTQIGHTVNSQVWVDKNFLQLFGSVMWTFMRDLCVFVSGSSGALVYSGAAGALFISDGVVSEGPGNALPRRSAKGTVINQWDTALEPSTSLGPETPRDAGVTLP